MLVSANWLEVLPSPDSLDVLRDLALSHARLAGPYRQRLTALLTKKWGGDIRGVCETEIDLSLFVESKARHLQRLRHEAELLLAEDHPLWDICQVTALEETLQGPCSLTDECLEDLEREAEQLAARELYNTRQVIAFFSKLEELDLGIDTEAVALKKALEAEADCKLTNETLRLSREGKFSFSPRVCAAIHAAQRKIAKVLGPVPAFSELQYRFGPGSTVATRKREACARTKLSARLQCSEEFITAAQVMLEELPHLTEIHSSLYRMDEEGREWESVNLEIVEAIMDFVPKNFKTKRSINKEPGLNVMAQLAVGDYMARRLRRFGIDIRDQSVNQRRALEGSLTGALATLDLSSASDTVALETVYECLPLDWAVFLARLRSKKVQMPNGSVLAQEKFSSMGNGFTFPLETLIFWGLAASVCEKDADVSVYGDDIIVPTDRAEVLIEVLTCLGFKVNQEKSFLSGPFRESCGSDYIWGIDVRPHFQKEWISGRSLYVLHNYYVRRGLQHMADRVLSLIPENAIIVHFDENLRVTEERVVCRLFGPDGYGDGHLLGDHPMRRTKAMEANGYTGYFFETFVGTVERHSEADGMSEHVLPLYAAYRRVTEEPLEALRMDPVELPFWGKFNRRCNRHGTHVSNAKFTLAPSPLKEDKDGCKLLDLPSVSGYKKVRVYCLG